MRRPRRTSSRRSTEPIPSRRCFRDCGAPWWRKGIPAFPRWHAGARHGGLDALGSGEQKAGEALCPGHLSGVIGDEILPDFELDMGNGALLTVMDHREV